MFILQDRSCRGVRRTHTELRHRVIGFISALLLTGWGTALLAFSHPAFSLPQDPCGRFLSLPAPRVFWKPAVPSQIRSFKDKTLQALRVYLEEVPASLARLFFLLGSRDWEFLADLVSGTMDQALIHPGNGFPPLPPNVLTLGGFLRAHTHSSTGPHDPWASAVVHKVLEVHPRLVSLLQEYLYARLVELTYPHSDRLVVPGLFIEVPGWHNKFRVSAFDFVELSGSSSRSTRQPAIVLHRIAEIKFSKPLHAMTQLSAHLQMVARNGMNVHDQHFPPGRIMLAGRETPISLLKILHPRTGSLIKDHPAYLHLERMVLFTDKQGDKFFGEGQPWKNIVDVSVLSSHRGRENHHWLQFQNGYGDLVDLYRILLFAWVGEP